ncbi:hypothetical protein QBC39DRAFT_136511 [Podospora conica]|nr:hypothetical protein QBC39DRAFT_136511 [Schizothecium conicum]
MNVSRNKTAAPVPAAWLRGERRRPVVAAGLGHCGTGETAQRGKVVEGQKKRRDEGFFAGVSIGCFRCLGRWGSGLAVTHSRGSAQGWIASLVVGRDRRAQSNGCQELWRVPGTEGLRLGFFPWLAWLWIPGLQCRSTAGLRHCHSLCRLPLCPWQGSRKRRRRVGRQTTSSSRLPDFLWDQTRGRGDSPLIRTAPHRTTASYMCACAFVDMDVDGHPRARLACCTTGTDHRPPATDLLVHG